MRPALIFLAIFALADGARILGLFPHIGKSHQVFFDPLLRTLAERGHHVTVASFFPIKDPPANYTIVGFHPVPNLGVETTDLSGFENKRFLHKIRGRLTTFQMLAELALDVCKNAVAWPPLTAALKKEYDVVLVESFTSDCMLGLLDVYNMRAPIVGLSSCSLMPWTALRFGLDDNPSHVPLISFPFSTQMTFSERIENTLSNIFYRYWFKYEIQAKEQAMIEKQFGRKTTPLDELARNMSLLLVNTFHPLNGVKPSLPAIVEVGGMHLESVRKPIPHVSYVTICTKTKLNYCNRNIL